jgi:hypothetical protein
VQSLNYNKDSGAQSSYNPPVNPYDVKFHRGLKGPVGPSGASENAFQKVMSKTIIDYTKGSIGNSEFRA